MLKLALDLGVDVRREHGGYQEGWLCNGLWYGVRGDRTIKISRADVDSAYALMLQVRDELARKADDINRSGSADLSVGQVGSLCTP